MKQKKRIVFTFIAGCLLAQGSFAQSSTNSPYSRYGFGHMNDQSMGFNKGMAGLSYGLRDGAIINQTNPAAYAEIDSVTFLFDGGISFQRAEFKQNGTSVSANNGALDYAAFAFRIRRGLGFSLGFLPYSTIGYDMTQTGSVSNDQYTTNNYVNEYNGDGGLHKVYAGLGWKPFSFLSVGVNGSFIYGELKHFSANLFSSGSTYSTLREYKSEIYSYKLDFGLQFNHNLSKTSNLTVGAVFSPGHSMPADAKIYDLIGSFSSISSGESLITQAGLSPTYVAKDAYELPTSFGVGFTLRHNNKLLYGVDYSLEKWSNVKFPTIQTQEGKTTYTSVKGLFDDRHKITAGMEWNPNMYSRNYLKRMKYRVGAYYATPSIKYNNGEGATEYGVSAGFGFPVQNQYNNRSYVNLSAQWVHFQPKSAGMMSENYFRICLGLTFNESWFRKWKVE